MSLIKRHFFSLFTAGLLLIVGVLWVTSVGRVQVVQMNTPLAKFQIGVQQSSAMFSFGSDNYPGNWEYFTHGGRTEVRRVFPLVRPRILKYRYSTMINIPFWQLAAGLLLVGVGVFVLEHRRIGKARKNIAPEK